MDTKNCPTCKIERNIEDFRRQTGLKNKFNKICMYCIAPYKKRYNDSREEKLAYSRQYREDNKEYFQAYRRRWGKENRQALNSWANKRYDDPTEKEIQLTRARLRNLIDKAFEFESELGCSFVEFKAQMEYVPAWNDMGKLRSRRREMVHRSY
jgi:hypothetical protein